MSYPPYGLTQGRAKSCDCAHGQAQDQHETLRNMNVVALKCAGCGAILDIAPDMDQFACGYCGLSQRVERKGGTVSLKRLEAVVRKIETATNRTAAELAYPRLKRELKEVDKERERLLETAHHGLPTAYNWFSPLCGLGYYSVGWFALVFLFSGKYFLAAIVGVMWLLSWSGKDQPTIVLTTSSAKELANRKKAIEERISAKKADLERRIAAERRVLDNLLPLPEAEPPKPMSALHSGSYADLPKTPAVLTSNTQNADRPEPRVYVMPRDANSNQATNKAPRLKDRVGKIPGAQNTPRS